MRRSAQSELRLLGFCHEPDGAGGAVNPTGGKIMMIFHHISLNCRDALALERFYSRHFGFKRARVVQLPIRQIVFLKGGDIYLELFPAPGERPGSPNTEGEGLTPSWRKGMMIFHHVSLNCRDALAIERFYTRHFGFKRARVVQLPNRQIVFLKGGNVYLELFPAQGERLASPNTSGEGLLYPGVRGISFMVDNLDAQLAAMGDAARITLGPLDFKDFIPGWRSVWLADPEGNVLQVTQGFVDQETPPPLPAE
jgi:glyoxylase I family protein